MRLPIGTVAAALSGRLENGGSPRALGLGLCTPPLPSRPIHAADSSSCAHLVLSTNAHPILSRSGDSYLIACVPQGFLRSATSLIQTIGRAARHVDGMCLLYTDSGSRTPAMEAALAETERRRKRQLAYNEAHGITPKASSTAGKQSRGQVAALLKKLAGSSAKTTPFSPKEEPPGGDLAGSERAVYDAIFAWRTGVARAKQTRPYMVLTEKTMRAVAVAKPSCEAELLAVKGIGTKKVEAFGAALMSS